MSLIGAYEDNLRGFGLGPASGATTVTAPVIGGQETPDRGCFDPQSAIRVACAQEGQTRPSLEAAADLLNGAARMRLRPMPGQPRTVFAAIWLMIAAAAAELGILVTLLTKRREPVLA